MRQLPSAVRGVIIGPLLGLIILTMVLVECLVGLSRTTSASWTARRIETRRRRSWALAIGFQRQEGRVSQRPRRTETTNTILLTGVGPQGEIVLFEDRRGTIVAYRDERTRMVVYARHPPAEERSLRQRAAEYHELLLYREWELLRNIRKHHLSFPPTRSSHHDGTTYEVLTPERIP